MGYAEVMKTLRINERASRQQRATLEPMLARAGRALDTYSDGYHQARIILARYRHDPRRAYGVLTHLARRKDLSRPFRRCMRDAAISLYHHVIYHLDQPYRYALVQRFAAGPPDLVVLEPDLHGYTIYAKDRFFHGYAMQHTGGVGDGATVALAIQQMCYSIGFDITDGILWHAADAEQVQAMLKGGQFPRRPQMAPLP